jgi:hypothetical protein
MKATLAEIARATERQNHRIRGFVTWHVTKNLGLKVKSTKSGAGGRTYRIVSEYTDLPKAASAHES